MALVVLFDPRSPHQYQQFNCKIVNETGSLLGLLPPISLIDPQLLQRPHLYITTIIADLKVLTHTPLPTVIQQLGGLQAILFLVAKVSSS